MAKGRRRVAERLALGVSGQVVSRVVSAANSIILVPILIHAWGLQGYGQWMALTALASFLSYSNFGLVSTSAYEMVMAAGASDHVRARRAFQMSVNAACYIVLPIIALAVLGAGLAPLGAFMPLSEIGHPAAVAILAFSGMQLWAQTLRGLFTAALYSVGSYGFSYYVNASVKALELAAVAFVVLAFDGGPVVVAGILLLSTTVDFVWIAIAGRRATPWARFNFRTWDMQWLKSHMRPAIGFLLSNLATQSFLVQAPRVVLGVMLGGQAVAIYSVYSTAMRLADQLLLIIASPLEVEIARSVGRAEPEKTYRIAILGTQFSWIAFAAVSTVLLAFGPLIFQLWTQGNVPFSHSLMVLVALMSGCTMIGRISVLALTSSNRLFGPSFAMMAFASVGLALGAILTPHLGIPGVVIGSAVGELSSSLFAIHLVCRWLEMPTARFFLDIVDLKSSARELAEHARGLLQRFRR